MPAAIPTSSADPLDRGGMQRFSGSVRAFFVPRMLQFGRAEACFVLGLEHDEPCFSHWSYRRAMVGESDNLWRPEHDCLWTQHRQPTLRPERSERTFWFSA